MGNKCHFVGVMVWGLLLLLIVKINLITCDSDQDQIVDSGSIVNQEVPAAKEPDVEEVPKVKEINMHESADNLVGSREDQNVDATANEPVSKFKSSPIDDFLHTFSFQFQEGELTGNNTKDVQERDYGHHGGYGHEKCYTTYKTVYKTIYETIYKKKCHTSYDKKCHTIYDTKYKKKCSTSYSKKCHTSYKTIYNKKCKTYYDHKVSIIISAVILSYLYIYIYNVIKKCYTNVTHFISIFPIKTNV